MAQDDRHTSVCVKRCEGQVVFKLFVQMHHKPTPRNSILGHVAFVAAMAEFKIVTGGKQLKPRIKT